MAGINKGLKVDDRVRFIETGNAECDGLTGTVLGTSFDYIHKAHIVLLDTPYGGEKAISITEACLERICDAEVQGQTTSERSSDSRTCSKESRAKMTRISFLDCPHNNVQEFTECCLDCGYNVYTTTEEYRVDLLRQLRVVPDEAEIRKLERTLGIKNKLNVDE